MKKTIIGVMGPGSDATNADLENAYQLGKLIAKESWILLTGGRKIGVMNAASRGAKAANGLTIGILPDHNIDAVSEAVDIAIFTDMGNARNNINVLSSDVVIACGIGVGTISEIALGIKNNKSIILLNDNPASQDFLKNLSSEQIYVVKSSQEAIATTKKLL